MKVARRAPLGAAGLYLAGGLVPVVIALLAPQLPIAIPNGEQLIPAVARHLMPTLLYAAFVGAFVSAILSTVDSTLLTASGLLSHNIVVPLMHISSERGRVVVARAGVLVLGILAYALALSAEGVFQLVEYASAMGSSGALVAICFGLFTRFGGGAAATVSLILGAVTYIGASASGLETPYLLSVAVALTGFLVTGGWETVRTKRAGGTG